MSIHDFDLPKNLSPRAREAADTILRVANNQVMDSTAEGGWVERDTLDYPLDGGGCRAFYTPEEWKARGENDWRGTCLIVCHDGGDLSPFFNLDEGAYLMWDRMFQTLQKKGFLAEQATSWYTCIYDETTKEN